MINEDVKEKIIHNAVSLEKYGLKEIAWNKKDAINLIKSLMTDTIGILGGDVYHLKSNRLEPLYDNWSCEPKELEELQEYYLRSKAESLNYIERYHINNENILFSITFTESIAI